MAESKIIKPVIALALDKNRQVRDMVEQSERELAIVHAVLDKQVPSPDRDGDIGHAVASTKEVGKKLTKSVALLRDVNRTLLSELAALEKPK